MPLEYGSATRSSAGSISTRGGSLPAPSSDANGVAPSASPYTKISSTPERSAAAVALSSSSGTVTSSRAPESTSCLASSSSVSNGFAVVFTPPADRDTVERDRILGQVRGAVSEHVALAEAARGQSRGQPADRVDELSVGDRPAARPVYQRGLVWRSPARARMKSVNGTSGISTSGYGLRITPDAPRSGFGRVYFCPCQRRIRPPESRRPEFYDNMVAPRHALRQTDRGVYPLRPLGAAVRGARRRHHGDELVAVAQQRPRPFRTMALPAHADAVAPDGSDVRVLLSVAGGEPRPLRARSGRDLDRGRAPDRRGGLVLPARAG